MNRGSFNLIFDTALNLNYIRTLSHANLQIFLEMKGEKLIFNEEFSTNIEN
jgi:hypothetical protein